MKKLSLIIGIVTVIAIIVGVFTYASTQGIAVLDPQGPISSHQRDLFTLTIVLGCIALLPVFIITTAIIHRYHAGGKFSEKRYNSTWEIKPEASWIWAAFVTIIITILSVVMIRSTHAIDPYRSIASETKPLSIRVVALEWKWLFIYPEEKIATVNELVIPENTPIAFELTADAPMSSLWIPQLGGMIYAMEGMVTQLNLEATSVGTYEGRNTEINGEGYSGMKFKTKAVNRDEYDTWVAEVKALDNSLDTITYEKLSRPTINHPVEYFADTEPGLFSKILAKFMDPSHSNHDSGSHSTSGDH